MADLLHSSPQGRVFQVEYAQEAVKQGSVVVGIVSKTHVVLAAIKVKCPCTAIVRNLLTLPPSETPKNSHPTKRRSFPSTRTMASRLPASPPMPVSSPTT